MTEPDDPTVVTTVASHPNPAPNQAPDTAADLRTFLIADIRGYTTYTREHGDEAAAALASRFAELVEEVIKEREGFLVELRGDEALVVFVSARRALRAAMDLQARFKEAELPRGVGIGLDAGEAIPVGTGYRGTALNLAARLCAAAGPGETLASETVIHLAAKMDGIAYVDARALKLKGYSESVRVVDVVPAEQAKGRRTTASGGWFGRGRRRYAVVAGGAVTALIVAVVAANALGLGPFRPATLPDVALQPTASTTAPADAASNPPTGDPSSAAPASPDPLAFENLPLLAFYDGATGELRTTTPFSNPRNISFYSAGSYWILGVNPPRFHRIDGATHQVVQSINVPVDEPSGFNFDDRSIWVTDLAGPTVVRIDKATGVDVTFDFAEDEDDTAPATDIAVGAGSVWLARAERGNGEEPEITRVDAETGEVQARIPVRAFGVSYGEDSLWYWAEGRLGRIDPNTNEPAFEELELGVVGWLGNIYFGGDYAWTTESDSGTVWRVDPQGRRLPVALEPGVGEMAYTTGTMWVTNANTGVVTGIDVVTGGHARVINTGHATLAVAAGGDELMIAVGPTDTELIEAVEGEVLRISTAYQPWFDPPPDTALNDTWEARQGFYVTCVHLVNYPDEPGPAGWVLAPEVAEDVPAVSEDGRTYTFTIKEGYVFSPPSDEPVTAETFKSTLERVLDPVFSDDAAGPAFFSDIEGVAAFRAGDADDISGIVADGDQLTITLEAPSPTFLERLTLSVVCPVPIETPALRSGLNPDPPVSGAGPYYVATSVQRRLVILKKNPNYSGPRPQPFDAISFRMRMSPNTAIQHVHSGLADAAVTGGYEPLTSTESALAETWGPSSANAEAGDQRWFGAPRYGFDYLALNPRPDGPFSDPDVRKAVALAIDRRAIASIWVTGPTDDLFFPGMPGSDFPGPPVAEPDIDAALALMDGRTVDVTMQGFPDEWGCGECTNFEQAMIAQLQAVHINVNLVRGDDYPADALEPGSEVDMVHIGTGHDIPDLVHMLGGLRDNTWLGEENLAELTRLEALSGPTRHDGAIAFAQRLVDEEALVIPTGSPVFPMYLSDRVGCGFVQPAVGAVDLLSLCVEDEQ